MVRHRVTIAFAVFGERHRRAVAKQRHAQVVTGKLSCRCKRILCARVGAEIISAVRLQETFGLAVFELNAVVTLCACAEVVTINVQANAVFVAVKVRKHLFTVFPSADFLAPPTGGSAKAVHCLISNGFVNDRLAGIFIAFDRFAYGVSSFFFHADHSKRNVKTGGDQNDRQNRQNNFKHFSLFHVPPLL